MRLALVVGREVVLTVGGIDVELFDKILDLTIVLDQLAALHGANLP